ncbi:OadG family protein [Leucothrix pacifica]|uniref:Probable oxaloacetate decarboxylase gamma chain n=1 Tax=Leucothrix pacifica TaxID=1247513 RepID=A0A317CGD5_9GAMM|nr:OadG family protein [Leucothrix pacifica]PWQ96493.1 oxaloacetate decarboxylase [Leucothrix pacifica]
MESSLIAQGFDLMLFGMGTVFVFLTLLIFATTAMSKAILRWFPEKVVEAPAPRKKPAAVSGSAIAPATLNILQAAIDKHRKR